MAAAVGGQHRGNGACGSFAQIIERKTEYLHRGVAGQFRFSQALPTKEHLARRQPTTLVFALFESPQEPRGTLRVQHGLRVGDVARHCCYGGAGAQPPYLGFSLVETRE